MPGMYGKKPQTPPQQQMGGGGEVQLTFSLKREQDIFLNSPLYSCVKDYCVLSCMASDFVFPAIMQAALWHASLEQSCVTGN